MIDKMMSGMKPSDLLDFAVDHAERIERGQSVEAEGHVFELRLDMRAWVTVPGDDDVCSAGLAGAAFLGAHDYVLDSATVLRAERFQSNGQLPEWMTTLNMLRNGNTIALLPYSHPITQKWLCARERSGGAPRFAWTEYREMAEDLRKAGC